jgi:hypothetical protein
MQPSFFPVVALVALIGSDCSAPDRAGGGLALVISFGLLAMLAWRASSSCWDARARSRPAGGGVRRFDPSRSRPPPSRRSTGPFPDGRQAAVKVQRPEVAQRVHRDLDISRRLAARLERRTQMGANPRLDTDGHRMGARRQWQRRFLTS